MKKLLLYVLIINLFFVITCKKSNHVPVGKWEYKLLVNGAEIGSATISNEIQNNQFRNETNMSMKAGILTNTSQQIITETTSFKPIKYELYNKIINNKSTQNIDTIANFNGNTVELIAGKLKSKVFINKAFYLAGNYFLSELIKKDFKKGTEIKAYVYDPAIEAEIPLPAKMKVMGEEKIKINDKEEELIHVVQVIDKFKSIDYYMDESGVSKKIVIIMLNTMMELVIK